MALSGGGGYREGHDEPPILLCRGLRSTPHVCRGHFHQGRRLSTNLTRNAACAESKVVSASGAVAGGVVAISSVDCSHRNPVDAGETSNLVTAGDGDFQGRL